MNDLIYLDDKYSTTKLITNESPVLEKNSIDKLKSQLFLADNKNRKGEGGLRTKGLFKKSYKNKPLISIVTVVYNGDKHLEQTINSVLGQTYDNVEYIIIDGGSTDGTLGILSQYEEIIDYWVSEPDGGIYNAMNKGLGLCSGKYVAFLNADDWYNLDALSLVSHSVEKKIAYVFGIVDIIKGGIIINRMTPNFDKYKVVMPFGHPSLFVKRSILLNLGFNEKYEIIADYDLVLRLIKRNYSYIYINKTIANFRYGGVSTIINFDREYYRLLTEHFGVLYALYRKAIKKENFFSHVLGLLMNKLNKVFRKF